MARIQLRRGTSAQWSSSNPVLAVGEPGRDTTVKRSKTGDGVTSWASLPWDAPSEAELANIHAPVSLADDVAAKADAAAVLAALDGKAPATDIPRAAHVASVQTSLTNADKAISRQQLNVKDFGAKGDWKSIPDGAITGTSVSSPNYTFTAADVGKYVTVYDNNTGVGVNANHINGRISTTRTSSLHP